MDDDNNNINKYENEDLEIRYTENPDVSKSIVNKVKEKKGILGILAVIGAVLAKFKFIIILIFSKLKFVLIALKLGKFTSTLVSMLFMIVIYAQMYGFAYGLGFVLLILAHEMGHYIVARRLNMDVSGPVFIPFLGAFIKMKDQPTNAVVEAKTAAGGPILGSLGALMCVLLYMTTENNLFLALAYTGFMINLFNLIPVHPLDGGRIVTAISPKMWFVGIPILLFMSIKFFNPIILIFLIMGCIQAYKQWKEPSVEYYNTSMSTKIIFSLIYFGLMAVLGFGIFDIHNLHTIYIYR